jgi:hypothetical protein
MLSFRLLLIAAAVACDTGSSSAPESGTGPPPAEPAGANLSGLRPHQGANCPASLPGANTAIAMTPVGVDVSVTSGDPATARRIVELAAFHARGVTAEASHPHDMQHGGTGRMGYCPIIVNEMTVITTTIKPGGVTVHVDARSPSDVREVQDLVKARAARLPGFFSS